MILNKLDFSLNATRLIFKGNFNVFFKMEECRAEKNFAKLIFQITTLVIESLSLLHFKHGLLFVHPKIILILWTAVCYLKNEFIKVGNKLELQITTKMLGGNRKCSI